MKTIRSRLQRLEQRFAPAAPAPSGASVAEQSAEGLARIRFVRGEEESLAETFARFLGTTPSELRAWLQRRATGQPAE
jgi:DNA-binding transcriptional regulator YiaG